MRPFPTLKCFMYLLVFAAARILGQEAPHEILTGTLYEIGSQRHKVLYRWTLEHDEKRGIWTSVYTTPSGEVNTEDKVLWEGDQLGSYSYTRHKVHESAAVLRTGETLRYTRTIDGETREAVGNGGDDFTVGPTVFRYVERHWQELTGGAVLHTDYGVLEKLRSYRFELARDLRHPANGPDQVVIRMRASNPLIRLFIGPIHMVFSADGKRFRAMIGRSLPVDVVNGRRRPTNAELVVEDITRVER